MNDEFKVNETKLYTFEEVYTMYISIVELLLAEHTLVTYKSIYNKHLEKHLCTQTFIDLNYLEYQKLLNNLLKDGLKPKTVTNIRNFLYSIYKYAMKLKIVDENPIELTELPKFDNKMYFSFPEKIQKHFINSVLTNKMSYDGMNPDFKDILLFLLHGRRKSEVLKMKWGYINFETGLKGWYSVPAHINKTRSLMRYSMTKPLRDMLKKRYAKLNPNVDNTKKYVFENPYTKDRYKEISKSWKSFLKHHSLPYMRLHDIRHLIGTYCTNYLKLPINDVQYALGHKDPKTTQIYITNNPDLSKNVTNAMFKSVS